MTRILWILIILGTLMATLTIKLDAQISPIMGIEIGYNIANGLRVEDTQEVLGYNYDNSLAIQLKTGLKIGALRIIGTYENTLLLIKIDNYNPIQDRFDIDITYDIGDFKIGLRHWCTHPVKDQNDKRTILFNAGKRSIYIAYYKEF